MTAIKRLAGQTAIYGIPSVLGRILGYLLVPLYTAVFKPGAYGTVSVFYAYTSFLMVVLTYGMETTYFRFNENEQDKEKVVQHCDNFSYYHILIISGSSIKLCRKI